MLKLESGKRYWRRDGGVSGPLRENSKSHYSNQFTDGQQSWYINGRYYYDGYEGPFDLIREYIQPQPLEWKHGIPTERECRECWIVTGGFDAVPDSMGVIHAPGELELRHWGNDAAWYLAISVVPVTPPKPKTVTQRQYISETREELWTQHDVASLWKPTGLTREVEQ